MTISTVAIDEETRELAYRIWCGSGGRSAAKVSRILAAEPYSREVKSNTIAQWAIRDQWAEQLASELGGVLGGMERETATNLVAAANLASRELVAAIIEYQETGKPPSKDATSLLTSAISLGGFSPVGVDKTAGKIGTADQRRGLLAYLSADDVDRIKSGSHR